MDLVWGSTVYMHIFSSARVYFTRVKMVKVGWRSGVETFTYEFSASLIKNQSL